MPSYRFVSRIGVRDAIAREIRWVQRNNRYTVGEMLLALLYPMILGLERIETAQLLLKPTEAASTILAAGGRARPASRSHA